MPGFEPGDVVKAPSPYTDARTTARRHALVLASAGPAENPGLLLWALMITSADNRGWPDDMPVDAFALAGLSAPSVVRCAKVATLDATRTEPLGRLPPETLVAVRKRVGALLRVTWQERFPAGPDPHRTRGEPQGQDGEPTCQGVSASKDRPSEEAASDDMDGLNALLPRPIPTPSP